METSRILLRPWRERDAETLFKYASDPDVGPRAGWPPHQSVEESLEIIRTVFHNDTTWAIELKTTGEPVGCMGFMPKFEMKIPAREGDALIGYWVGKPYWNQGICTEALQLMLDHIRQTKAAPSLVSSHFVDNPASGRVMEKCGFIATGEICFDETQYNGKDHPMRVLRLELDDAVQTTELLRTSQSWDGAEMPDYPKGKPELVAIRYVFPPGKKLGWHHHDVMNYGYVEQGELTIITIDGKEKTVRAGEALVEMVGTIHHGENRGTEPVILNMFYISQKGMSLSVPHPVV